VRQRLEENSRLRVRLILGELSASEVPWDLQIELDRFGIEGRQRSLEEYQRCSGVNFREKTIAEAAKFGNLDPELFYENFASKLLHLAEIK
jgi:hypothetical protein